MSIGHRENVYTFISPLLSSLSLLGQTMKAGGANQRTLDVFICGRGRIRDVGTLFVFRPGFRTAE